MSKIEEIEQLLSKWKAAGCNAYIDKHTRLAEVYVDRVYGLRAALEILNRPSNLENATGAKCVCPLCNQPHDPKLISGDGPMKDGHR